MLATAAASQTLSWAATKDVFRSPHNKSERAGGEHDGKTSGSRQVCRDGNAAGLGKNKCTWSLGTFKNKLCRSPNKSLRLCSQQSRPKDVDTVTTGHHGEKDVC